MQRPDTRSRVTRHGRQTIRCRHTTLIALRASCTADGGGEADQSAGNYVVDVERTPAKDLADGGGWHDIVGPVMLPATLADAWAVTATRSARLSPSAGYLP